MRILLVSHQLDFSGAPNALLGAARVLVREGVAVDLLTLSHGPLAAGFEEIGTRLITRTDFLGYDLVILNTVVTAKLAFSIPKTIRYLIWIHESPLLFIHSDIPYIVSRAAEKASALIFPTDSTAQEWARYSSMRQGRVHVFNTLCPVDLPSTFQTRNRTLIRSERTIKPLRVITIDPVEYFRGFRVLAQSIREVASEGLEISYTAVGATRQQVDSIFEGSGVVEVNATGRLPRTSVLELLQQSDLYVSTSAFATQNLGLCEATLLGVPSIASDIAVHRAWAEKMGGAVLLSGLFEPEELSCNIKRVAASYTAYQAIAQSAKVVARDILSDERFKYTLMQIIRLITTF